MDLNKDVLVIDVLQYNAQLGATLAGGLVDRLPCLQTDCTSASLSSSSPQLGREGWVTVVDLAGASLAPIDNKVWQLARRLLVGGTARSYLIVGDKNQSPLDARTLSVREWAPEKSDLRSNVELRIRRLVTIKAAFGLSNSDLARICHVSRTQLYKWLSSDEALQLESANWQRLADLAQFAEDWNVLSSKPARDLLSEKVQGNKTLMMLLAASQLDHHAIHGALEKLAKITAGRPLRREEKLRQTGVHPRPVVGQLAWDE